MKRFYMVMRVDINEFIDLPYPVRKPIMENLYECKTINDNMEAFVIKAVEYFGTSFTVYDVMHDTFCNISLESLGKAIKRIEIYSKHSLIQF